MEIIFNMYKIKFSKLDELFTTDCKSLTKDSEIILYINLESIYRKLVSSNISNYLKVKNGEKVNEFVSCIFNLVAHYRLFFSKNGLKSKIYVYLPDSTHRLKYKNTALINDYREGNKLKFKSSTNYLILGQLIKDATPIAKTILEYISGVNIIESSVYEPSLIPYVIGKGGDNGKINMILTTDQYESQYANLGYYVMVPKQENSYIIHKDNLIDKTKEICGVKSDIELHPSYISTILSLLGDDRRGIPKFKGVGLGTVLKVINNAQKEKIIGDETTSPVLISEILQDKFKSQFLLNYYCTDLNYQFKTLSIDNIQHIESQIKDKFDNLSLKAMQEKYFKVYPLYLMEIQATPKVKNKIITF